MYSVDTLRSKDLPVRERGDWWRHQVSSIHSPMAFTLPDDYRGKIEHQRSCTYQVVRWWGAAEVISRRDADVRRHPHGAYELLVPMRGVLTLRQSGITSHISPKDMAITSLDHALDLRHGDAFSCVAFVIPRERLDARIPGLSQHNAVLRASAGLGRIAVDLLMSVHRQRDVLTGGQFDAISDRLVDLLALAYHEDTTAPSTDVQDGLIAAVRRFVRQNAHDPELTGTVVAARLGWSLRHVQAQLQRAGTTPSDLIRDERLALARLRLQDPRWRGQSVTQVAYSSGFGGLSSFSNAYRRAFGERPSETRAASAADD